MGMWLELLLWATSAAASGQILELLPAAPTAAQAFWANESAPLDTWGGSVVQDDAGKFHLYAAAMAKGCALAQWATNSYVLHAVSESPTGPFRRPAGAAGTAVPLWAHNPQVVRHTDGTYLLFSIGAVNATQPCECPQPVPRGFCPRPKIYPWADEIQLHFADSPDGPWHSVGRVIWGSNPSPYVMRSTGEVFVAFKGGMQIARASHWRGPYEVISKLGGVLPAAGPSFPSIEDAFLWFDESARRWNCLYHQYSKTAFKPSGPGGYAYSAVDSILNWTWGAPNGRSVYPWNVSLAGGKAMDLQSRQRPKLLLDARGQPAVLYNGVEFDGRSHTFAQRVKAFTPPYLRPAAEQPRLAAQAGERARGPKSEKSDPRTEDAPAAVANRPT